MPWMVRIPDLHQLRNDTQEQAPALKRMVRQLVNFSLFGVLQFFDERKSRISAA